MNARTNLGITCKQDILKQNMFATLANNLNESEKGFLIYNRSFHFRSKSAFPLILLDARRAYDVISHDDSFIEACLLTTRGKMIGELKFHRK